MTSRLNRSLGTVVTLWEGEAVTALLMFAYSFLAMTAYNIVRPITRSKFISDLGADNLPYVVLAAGVLIGVLMQFYSWAIARVARRSVIPATQTGAAITLVLFWFLFQSGAVWVSVAFSSGPHPGVLLISCSGRWPMTSRSASGQRLFRQWGASLGGAMPAHFARRRKVGTNNLPLVSAAILGFCVVLVLAISAVNMSRAISRQSVRSGRRQERRSGCANQITPAHRSRDRLCGGGRDHYRAAAQHGGRFDERWGPCHHRLSRASHIYPSIVGSIQAV
jgi:hypothetical protein